MTEIKHISSFCLHVSHEGKTHQRKGLEHSLFMEKTGIKHHLTGSAFILKFQGIGPPSYNNVLQKQGKKKENFHLKESLRMSV